MALKQQWVLVTVVYDDENGPPAEWDWETLLELNREAGEFVVMNDTVGTVLPWSGNPPNPHKLAEPEPDPEPEPEPDDDDEDRPCDCPECQLERGEYPCDTCMAYISNDDARVCGDCDDGNRCEGCYLEHRQEEHGD